MSEEKNWEEEWNKKKDELWTITLTREQLQLVANCVEDCARFACGQTELWNTISNLGLPTEQFCTLRDTLGKSIHPLVVPELGYSGSYGWSGHGCPYEPQERLIARTYMIYREILHQIAEEENWNNVYSSSTLRCEKQGRLIEVRKLKKDDKGDKG